MKETELERLRRSADDVADPLIARIAGREEDGAVTRVSCLLDALLAWKPGSNEPPEALREVLTEPGALPHWAASKAARQQLARAQQVFEERQAPAFVVLGLASLPACYRQPEIAELLGSSGRLAVQVFRRLRETADFVDGVMQHGAFEPRGGGFAWCRKVRFVHAAMRFLARHDPPPEGTPPGSELQDYLLRRSYAPEISEPIDQCELAFVLQTFGYLTVRGLRRLRIRFETREAEDFLFLWSVVGHLLGVQEELLPRPSSRSLEDQARQIYETIDASIQSREGGVTDGGRLLTATLIVCMREAMLRAVLGLLRARIGTAQAPRWMPRGVHESIERGVRHVMGSAPRSFLRTLLGNGVAEELGVGRAPLLHYLGHQVAFMTIRYLADRSAPVPSSWARTPAESWRRNAVLLFGTHIDRWQNLQPPPRGKADPRT